MDGISLFFDAEMSNFLMSKDAQGFSSRRTFSYVADAKPAENAAHRKKGHFWIENEGKEEVYE
jgi:hypothetical protein